MPICPAARGSPQRNQTLSLIITFRLWFHRNWDCPWALMATRPSSIPESEMKVPLTGEFWVPLRAGGCPVDQFSPLCQATSPVTDPAGNGSARFRDVGSMRLPSGSPDRRSLRRQDEVRMLQSTGAFHQADDAIFHKSRLKAIIMRSANG